MNYYKVISIDTDQNSVQIFMSNNGHDLMETVIVNDLDNKDEIITKINEAYERLGQITSHPKKALKEEVTALIGVQTEVLKPGEIKVVPDLPAGIPGKLG